MRQHDQIEDEIVLPQPFRRTPKKKPARNKTQKKKSYRASSNFQVEHLAGKHIVQIGCGYRHTIFVTDKGEAYSCGEGVDGKLGHGAEDSLLFPHHIKALTVTPWLPCPSIPVFSHIH